MAPERLICSLDKASIPVIQNTETPPKANPSTQSSSSVESQATGALTSMTGNYVEYT